MIGICAESCSREILGSGTAACLVMIVADDPAQVSDAGGKISSVLCAVFFSLT
jgi:hypothetical protein